MMMMIVMIVMIMMIMIVMISMVMVVIVMVIVVGMLPKILLLMPVKLTGLRVSVRTHRLAIDVVVEAVAVGKGSWIFSRRQVSRGGRIQRRNLFQKTVRCRLRGERCVPRRAKRFFRFAQTQPIQSFVEQTIVDDGAAGTLDDVNVVGLFRGRGGGVVRL